MNPPDQRYGKCPACRLGRHDLHAPIYIDGAQDRRACDCPKCIPTVKKD